ncbi:hypothetical protein WJX77_006128 [Trebouxia sp. C0004]
MVDTDPDADAPSSSGRSETSKPTVVLVIGMAGSGKTTLMQRLNSHLHTTSTPGYIINLDPAVTQVPYGANIDIRDTVNYKNVMKQYGLGPNGGILTSLNLFATRFDQVINLCEKQRDPPLKYVIVDTPGQIEIFTWSASGAIITEAFASGFPTMIAFIIDTPRCAHPQTFMSNMLQACSILYKSKLPMLLVFNKTDVSRHDFALDWMADFETFHVALQADSSYASTLSKSLSLVLEEFYCNLKTVGVSAVTGENIDEFFVSVEACAEEYLKYYKPEMDRKVQARNELEIQRQAKELSKLSLDRAESSQQSSSRNPAAKVVLDARARPPVQSADELDGHISDGSD